MNFYNDDEKKDGAPVIPGASSPFRKTSAFGKAPLFSRATGGIIDRLKNLSRKDMAFVGIGLSVLVMAPVAEYMMSKPTDSNLLTAGFGDRGGGSSLYEPGLGSLSAGSPDGSGEVITPLSARDPASLILGSQPAAPVMPAAAAPPSSNWRDSVKDAGREAFSAATKAAMPTTRIDKMSGALRSISSFAGGGDSSRTSGTLGGGKIIEDAKSASAKAAKRSMVGPVAMAGYKGVASSTPNSSSKGAFEKLRSQADKSAGNFSGGSAMSSLDKAAADAVQLGSGSGGAGGLGDGDKTTRPSNSSTKGYEHNRSGETLAEMAAKQRMQKALEWEFFKKYEIPKQIINAVVGAVASELGKFVGGAVGGVLNPAGPAPKPLYCWQIVNNVCSPTSIPMSMCGKDKPMGECRCCDIKPAGGTTPGGTTPGGTTPGGTTPGGTTPGHGGGGPVVTWPSQPASTFDDMFKALPPDVTKAVGKKDDAKAFTDQAVILAGRLADISGDGNRPYQFPRVVRYTTAKMTEFNRGMLDYKQKTSQARTGYTDLRAQNRDMIARLEGIAGDSAAIQRIGAAVGGQATKNTGAQAEIIASSATPGSILAKINGYIAEFKVVEESASTYEPELAFCERGVGFFEKQRDFGNGAAGGLVAGSKEIAAKAAELKTKLEGQRAELDSATADPLVLLPAIGESFKKLTGIPVEVGQSSAPAAAAREGEVSLIDQLLALRGGGKDPFWQQATIDDKKFKDAEAEAWKAISPKVKAEAENYTDELNSPDIPAEMRVIPVVNIRTENELPADLNKLRGMVGVMFSGDGKGALEQLKSRSDQLKRDAESVVGATAPGNTTGGNTGGNIGGTPPAVTDTALTGRQTAALAAARNAKSDYQAATAVHSKLGSGTNATYARSDYRKMTDAHANIVRLSSALEAPGAKPTKEQLDELEMYAGNFNKAYGEFQTHARAAGTPVPVVKPPPQVIINNNVSANANATAGANTTVRPTTVNNNTTAVVKPDPKPVVQPKPSAPVSFLVGAVEFKTDSNAGDTVVYKSNWTVYPWYTVTCSRQADNSFKITAGQKNNGISVSAYSGFNGRACR